MGVVGIGRLFNESAAVIAFGLAVCAAGYAAIEVSHAESKNKALENARYHATKVVEAAEAQLALTIKNAELTLMHVEELNRARPVCANGDKPSGTLGRMSENFSVSGSLSLLDGEGRVICANVSIPGSGIRLDDRDYFLALKDAAPGALALGGPVLNRLNDRWALPIARRLAPDGGDAVIAAAAIDLARIVEQLEAQRPGPNASMTLYLADKRLVARAPFDASLVGQTLDRAVLWQHYPERRQGQYDAIAVATDGVARMAVFRQVDEYPLVLAAAVARHDVLAEWRENIGQDRAVMAAAGLATMAFAFVLAARLGTLRRMRRESRRLALVAENTGNMVVIADPEGRIEWVNASFERVTGWQLHEIRGQKPGSFLFGPETSVETANSIRIALRERRHIDGIEILNYTKDRRTYWVRLNIRPVVDDGGQLLAFIGVQEDLTPRQRAEKERRDLADRITFATAGVGVGIWTLDPIARTVAWDERCHELLGVELGADKSPRDTLLSRILSQDVPRFDAAILDVVRNGVPMDLQFRVGLPAGGIRYLQAKGIAQRDRQGITHRVLGIVWDVTDTKELELRLTAERKRAEESNAAKSDFLSMMSHELRTPLNAIIGFAQMLEGEFFGPLGHSRYRGYATDIRQSGELLLALISGVLDINRMDRAQVPEFRDDLPIREILDEISPIIVETVAAGGHELDIDVDQGAVISGDRLMIKQLVINLVSNAAKYTKAGGRIQIAAKRHRDGSVGLSVVDNGIGIDPSDVGRAMEPFVRLNRKDKSDIPGLGLGLSIVKRIVDIHGAKFDIASKPGSGTDVTVTFSAPA